MGEITQRGLEINSTLTIMATATYMEAYQTRLLKATNYANIIKIVSDLLVINTPNIINEVRNRWKHGEGVKGGVIGSYRDPDYRMFKQSLNPMAGGNVDLMLTGALVENLTLRKIADGVYQIISTDEKYVKLALKYGSEEFGITEEQRQQLYADIVALSVEEIFKQIWS